MTDPGSILKIGYVTKMFPRLSETFILNEILELERRGVEVVIFSAKKPNEGRFHPQLSRLKAKVFYLEDLDAKKWPVWIGREWGGLSGYRDNLWRLLDESLTQGNARRIDHVWWAAWVACRARELGIQRLHAHFASLPTTLANLAHRVSGIPYSFTAHAKDIYVYTPEESRLREKIEYAEFMVTVTECNKRHIREQLPGIDADKIRVVYNGIDLDSFRSDESVARDTGHILGVGRLVPKKGFGDLLEACALLRDRGIRFQCTIVGGGVHEEQLHEQWKQLGLQDQVTFTGPKHIDHVRSLMQQATVFCLPCTVASDNNVDALPTVLLESLASGLPVVSTAISGVPEIVDSGVDGVLVSPDDPHALAGELTSLLESPDRRNEFARRGREKAQAKFDLKKNAGRLMELFLGGAAEGDGSPKMAVVPAGSSPRVLYVSTDKGIAYGGTKGASIHMREFLNALGAEGVEPTVAVRKRLSVDRRRREYPVYVLPADNRADAPASVALTEAREFAMNTIFEESLANLQNGGKFDMVYERYSLFGTAGREFALKAGVPFMLEVNAPLVEEASAYRGLQLTGLARDTEKYLFSTADHIIVVSEALRRYVCSVAPEARVTVIPNGVDVERFRKTARSSKWRESFTACEEDAFVVGFVGRVREWHGVDLLIDAVARARDDDPSIRLCVVGNARGFEEAFTERCRSLDLQDAVTFTGQVSPESVPDAIGAMDVVVAPYPRLESFYFSPLKIFEYMASGKPVVASAIGQIADVLEHETNALLVPPGDTNALADAFLRLRRDGELRDRIGAAAAGEVALKHTWRRRVLDVVTIMDRLVKPRAVKTG